MGDTSKLDSVRIFKFFLSAFWSLIGAAYIGAVTFMNIPEKNFRIVDTVLGFLLGTIVATVINYWLGSSSGSAAKNEIIAKAQPVDTSDEK
jgi:putative flippase GtrA